MPLKQILNVPFVLECPLCGGVADRIGVEAGGAIEETIWSAETRGVARKVRPATFWACSTCEWCAEKATLPAIGRIAA